MIDSKSHRTESIRLKRKRSRVKGDISQISNGHKLSNGSAFIKSEENESNKSWNVMKYEEYLDYSNRRHSTSGNCGATNLSSTSEQDGGTTPGFIFRFYKKFGFYWNVFPKTDYCYLPGSPDYKKEISPGIPKVPNLSRYPLPSFISRGVGLRSRSDSKYDSTAVTGSSFKSVANINADTIRFLSKEGFENVEARENLINKILSREEKRRSMWSRIHSVSYTCLTTIKRRIVTTFTTTRTEEVNARSNVNTTFWCIPLLLLLMLLLMSLYFFIPGFAEEYKIFENLKEKGSSVNFISWAYEHFASFIFLVKDSLLLIPTICQQLFTLFLTLFSTGTTQKEAITMDVPLEKQQSLPLVPRNSNFSRELTKEEMLALQSAIIKKTKEELAGRENFMSARIDKLQEQVMQLTGDIQKMSGTFEGDWRNRLNKLEEEIKMELTDIRHSVDDFGEKSVGQVVSASDKLIEKVVAKYHADRTGKPDYALQSSGGYIVRVRCTQMYSKTSANFYFLGIPLPWDVFNGPDTIIKPGVMPGECWAFEGSYAQVTLHLASKVKITGFSLEHAPRELLSNGQISSAPKQFSVWALDNEDDENPVFLGRFTFLNNGESLQQFVALEYDKAVELVELKVESNHGHPEYTCLYRFRVHGVPPPV